MTTTSKVDERRLPNGPAAAALLAAGVGAFAVGLLTTLSEAVASIGSGLNFYAPVGPLSGKTSVAVVVWLVSWGVLAAAFRDKDVDFGKVSVAAFILLLLGILGTFPPFFELFVAE